MDGTIVSEFLATLNTAPCFADHCDWRIPNWNELESIVSLDISYPLVDDGSLRGEYASATSDAADTNLAWGVDIRSRESVEISKVGTVRVRAVRGG